MHYANRRPRYRWSRALSKWLLSDALSYLDEGWPYALPTEEYTWIPLS